MMLSFLFSTACTRLHFSFVVGGAQTVRGFILLKYLPVFSLYLSRQCPILGQLSQGRVVISLLNIVTVPDTLYSLTSINYHCIRSHLFYDTLPYLTLVI